MQTDFEGVLTVKKDGHLVAIVYHDTSKRSQIFFTVSEMGKDEIEQLLNNGDGVMIKEKKPIISLPIKEV